jgi:hypothetical protein
VRCAHCAELAVKSEDERAGDLFPKLPEIPHENTVNKNVTSATMEVRSVPTGVVIIVQLKLTIERVRLRYVCNRYTLGSRVSR